MQLINPQTLAISRGAEATPLHRRERPCGESTVKSRARGRCLSHALVFVAATSVLFAPRSVSPHSQASSNLLISARYPNHPHVFFAYVGGRQASILLAKGGQAAAGILAAKLPRTWATASLLHTLHCSFIPLLVMLVLHLNVCVLHVPFVCRACTPGAFWGYPTRQGPLSANYGGYVASCAAGLGQVNRGPFVFICLLPSALLCPW